jgi:hypothetical protein
MRSWIAGSVVIASVSVVVGGCATSQEWSDWLSHPSHFASGEHAAFSLKTDDSSTRVRRADVEIAQAQNWWGKPIAVDKNQLLEN